jgi:hypothetical protein
MPGVRAVADFIHRGVITARLVNEFGIGVTSGDWDWGFDPVPAKAVRLLVGHESLKASDLRDARRGADYFPRFHFDSLYCAPPYLLAWFQL